VAHVTDREQRVLGIIETARAKRARFRDEHITMAHGAGGKATATLIEGLFVPAFASPALAALADAGTLSLGGVDVALTTDGFVVKPIRFPGGSIGELAVNGTVNDLAAAGARPQALTLSMVLEEGLPADVLRAEVEAIAGAASAAGVEVVAGDTKVVERGHADEMYLCTAGVGVVDPRASLAPAALRPGDRIIVSGTIGDHGTAIMLARGEFELDADVRSDTCSLWPAVDALLEVSGPQLRCLRDATRGGVASVLNELARASGVAIVVREGDVPIEPAVAGAAEILGIDPMYVANEGKLVAFVGPDGPRL
jgi:hydrogenase expression/formation protein HypE